MSRIDTGFYFERLCLPLSFFGDSSFTLSYSSSIFSNVTGILFARGIIFHYSSIGLRERHGLAPPNLMVGNVRFFVFFVLVSIFFVFSFLLHITMGI